MFKKGDVVVRLTQTVNPKNIGDFKNDIWQTGSCSYTGVSKPNRIKIHNIEVRKATDNEIKWFKAGITNINQIPEVGGTFNTRNDDTHKIKSFLNLTVGFPMQTEKGAFCLQYWVENYSGSYKPPVKSQHVGNEVQIESPFKPGDLKNCKIGNLTPEDHKIIQPWLFSLGYKWLSGTKKVQYTETFGLGVTSNYEVFKINIEKDFYINNNTIKKETILNYIKQLNTNKNEILRQNQENTRSKINGSARILSGRQQGSVGSRPKGNVTSVSTRKAYIRQSEVSGSVRLG